jgi:hypothetical protein
VKTLLFALTTAVIVVLPLKSRAAVQEVMLSNAGWTLTADPAAEVLRVSREQLGIILTNVQLKAPNQKGLGLAKGWTVSQRDSSRLVIRTATPPDAWVFEMDASALRVACTAPAAVLVAQAPVSYRRVAARLLDPEGVPVKWTGTGEVVASYHGSMTEHLSYLPQQNPDCMYLALGTVGGAVFHALFDRATDTAIQFPKQAEFQLGSSDPQRLELTLPFSGSVQIRLTPDYYTKILGVPFYIPLDEERSPQPPMTWSSWTSYYAGVTEEDVVKNTDWLAEHLQPYGFQYVVLDDGYDRGPGDTHYWMENWDQKKFPHGPKWLADYIKSKGLHPGMWLVPNSYAGAVQAHPDWYVYDKQGEIIMDYATPALDSSNPEVLEFLKKLFTTLERWGFEYYKFDGEHALPKYVPAVDPTRLHDPNADPVAVYRHRLEVIRGVLGPKAFIEACPAGTPLNGIGYFNSYFNGQDAYNNWHGMYSLFSSLNANTFLNRMVVYNMPGEGMELGQRKSVEEIQKERPAEVVDTARQREDPLIGFGLTMAEARTLVSLVALTGVAYPLGGVMPELPADRLPLLQRTLPTMPIRPVDLFSRGTDLEWDTFKHVRSDEYIHNYPEIFDLKVNAISGVYDVLALPNWRSATVAKSVAFADKLGLNPDRRYIAFDFWNQKLLGVFQNQLSVEIEGHDTRVVSIHPLLDHPQLIGTSRHISGAYSIRDLAWDESKRELHGTSETIAGDQYTLFVYVPDQTSVSQVQVTPLDGVLGQKLQENLLSVSFKGVPTPVNWRIAFGPTRNR